MRRLWLRRVLLVLLLLIGSSLTVLDACPTCHPAKEAVCQVHCMGDLECRAAPFEPVVDPVGPVEKARPFWPLVQTPREQAREPEHAPPRRG